MAKGRWFKLIWVFLLVVSAFMLGYTLKPCKKTVRVPPFMMRSYRFQRTFPYN